MKLGTLIWYWLASMTLFTVAIVQAVIGNQFAAIFLAIVWVGWTNNIGHTVAYHHRQGTLPHQRKAAEDGEQLNYNWSLYNRTAKKK